jgi:hypothetical protein
MIYFISNCTNTCAGVWKEEQTMNRKERMLCRLKIFWVLLLTLTVLGLTGGSSLLMADETDAPHVRMAPYIPNCQDCHTAGASSESHLDVDYYVCKSCHSEGGAYNGITGNSASPGVDGQPGVATVDDDTNGTVDDSSEMCWPGSDDTCPGVGVLNSWENKGNASGATKSLIYRPCSADPYNSGTTYNEGDYVEYSTNDWLFLCTNNSTGPGIPPDDAVNGWQGTGTRYWENRNVRRGDPLKTKWCAICHDQYISDTTLIEDFEGYTDDAGLQSAWVRGLDAKRPKLKAEMDQEPGVETVNITGISGQYMRVTLRGKKKNAKVTRTFSPALDFSSKDYFCFYLKVNNKRKIRKVTVKVTSTPGPTVYKSFISVNNANLFKNNTWKLVLLPKTSFSPALTDWGNVSKVEFIFTKKNVSDTPTVCLDEIGCDLTGKMLIGDDVTWGYYVTGHKFQCTHCHDTCADVTDLNKDNIFNYIRNTNNPRGFGFYKGAHLDNYYQSGSSHYGGTPYPDPTTLDMDLPYNEYIPGPDGSFALCYWCHNESAITTRATSGAAASGLATNFKDEGPMAMLTWDHNFHYLHVADTDNPAYKFYMTCVLCHDPHGHEKPAQTRNQMEGFIYYDADGCEVTDKSLWRDPAEHLGGARTVAGDTYWINQNELCGQTQCHGEGFMDFHRVAPPYEGCEKCHENKMWQYNECKPCHGVGQPGEPTVPPAEPAMPLSYAYDDYKNYTNTYPNDADHDGHWCLACHTHYEGNFEPSAHDGSTCENEHFNRINQFGNAYYVRTYSEDVLPEIGDFPYCENTECHGTGPGHDTHVAGREVCRGPELDCSDIRCHGGGLFDIDDMNVQVQCNQAVGSDDKCHSPGGAFDGTPFLTDFHWNNSVYDPATDPIELRAGNETWCATCHDDDQFTGGNESAKIDGVYAPGVAGDNTSYGYYFNGHGDKECPPGTDIECLECHIAQCDGVYVDNQHIDGDARTYAFDPSVNPSLQYYSEFSNPVPPVVDQLCGIDYARGYRLSYVGNKVPMMIPAHMTLTWDLDANAVENNSTRLCFRCHSSTNLFTQFWPFNTNFTSRGPDPPLSYHYGYWPGETVRNQHWYFTTAKNVGHRAYDSDWDDTTHQNAGTLGADAIITCPTCHNVHGAIGTLSSTNEAMIRDGSLAGRAGYGFSYLREHTASGGYPNVTSNASQSASVGAVFRYFMDPTPGSITMCGGSQCHFPADPVTMVFDASGVLYPDNELDYYRPYTYYPFTCPQP